MDLRQLPPLNAVRMFEAAARHESFSRAADELHVTHGAISHQVRALEEALGATLFLREGRRLSLTETGARYAQQVRAALMLLTDATREARARNRSRQLVVSTLPSFAARWMTPRIGSFIEKHPEIDLELHSTNALVDFARDSIDIAIRFGRGEYPGLHTEPLLDEVYFPVCAPTLNGGRLPRTPAELLDSTLLRTSLLPSDDRLWQRWFAEAGLPHVDEPRRGVLFHDSSNLLQAAIDGQGIALARRSLVMSDLAAGNLVRLFDIDGPSPWDYYFVCPPMLAGTPRVLAFRNWLFEEVAAFRTLYAQVARA